MAFKTILGIIASIAIATMALSVLLIPFKKLQPLSRNMLAIGMIVGLASAGLLYLFQ